jgi:hypothetical protein
MIDQTRSDQVCEEQLRNDEHRNDQLPSDRQAVQVKFDNCDWQPATYRYGQFVDAYGIPLDPEKISGWRPANVNGSDA